MIRAVKTEFKTEGFKLSVERFNDMKDTFYFDVRIQRFIGSGNELFEHDEGFKEWADEVERFLIAKTKELANRIEGNKVRQ